MKEKVDLTAFYPHSPARVWQALTTGEALARWLGPTDFKPVPGFRFRFEGIDRGEKRAVEGVVLEVEPLRRLVYSWDDGEEGSPGVVAWTLSPTDGGTRVRLAHKSSTEAEPYVLIEANANWRYAMSASLPALLRWLGGVRPTPVPIVYVTEDATESSAALPRAGFRQENEVICG